MSFSATPFSFHNPQGPSALTAAGDFHSPADATNAAVPCTISWPVLHFQENELNFQLLFIKSNHIIFLHPLTSEIISHHSIENIQKVSFDQSDEDVERSNGGGSLMNGGFGVAGSSSNKQTMSSDDAALYKLFRIVYKDQNSRSSSRRSNANTVTTDIGIFLSKDANEIVNAIISRMKQQKKQRMQDMNRYEDTQSMRDQQQNNHMDFGSSPVDYFGGGADLQSTMDEEKFTPYRYTIQSGHYQYQVFGVDKHGKLYPHSVAVFSHFIKHMDTRTKRIFAQHTYDHIVSVELQEQNRIRIRYENDNDYIFICSDHDRAELVCLLKGRVYLYQLLKSNAGISFLYADETNSTDVDTDSQREDDEEDTLRNLKEAGDFPTNFSYQNEYMANQDPFRFDPDMIKAVQLLQQQPHVLNQMNMGFDLDEYDFDPLNLDFGADETDVAHHLNNIKIGMEVWKLKRRKKGGAMHKRFMRFDDDCMIRWGAKRNKLKRSCQVVSILTGEDAEFPQNKGNKEYAFILKSADGDNDMCCAARDQNEFNSWKNGVAFLLKRRQETLRNMERTQEQSHLRQGDTLGGPPAKPPLPLMPRNMPPMASSSMLGGF
uniref:PH domain-containing protein n=1 Tax=Percolomonas cosmopolitus TaxID=63605 RepID=A0A7S1PJV8_9EUKA